MKQVEAAKRAAVLRSLVRRFHPEGEETLFSHLTGEERLRIEGLDVPAMATDKVMEAPLASLSPVHSSWLNEGIEKERPNLQPLYQSALYGAAPLSEPVRAYLLQHLSIQMGMHAVVPTPSLPTSELNVLLTIERRTLVLLSLYLGLRDLAQEMRATIERDALRAVEAVRVAVLRRLSQRIIIEIPDLCPRGGHLFHPDAPRISTSLM